MKVSFLIPPVRTPGLAPAERSAGCTRVVYPFPNIYELISAAVLRREGHDVALHDFVNPRLTVDQFRDFLRDDDSDIYCIWGVNLSIEDDTLAIADIISVSPQARVVMLGPSGTFFPEKFLTDDRVLIVRGEPEETLKALCAGEAPDDLPGITRRDSQGRISRNPSRPLIRDLDSLPFPDRSLLKGRDFHNPKLKVAPYTTVLTSRNCPFRCIYCVPSSLTFARELDYRHDTGHKPPIGFRSVENVAQELDMLAAQGYRAIGFVDDNFIWDEKRTAAICEVLRRNNMVWGCQARVDAITEPIAKMLGNSGCRYVDLGIESFNDEILKYIKKGITSDQIYTAIRLLQKYNVPVKLNLLIGTSPLETKETIRHTLREARRLKVDQVMVNIVSPFPGTPFYKLAMENGWIEGGEYRPTNVQRESILNYPHLSARQMERLLFRANLRFFLRPSLMLRQLSRFTSWKEFLVALKALRTKLFWR